MAGTKSTYLTPAPCRASGRPCGAAESLPQLLKEISIGMADLMPIPARWLADRSPPSCGCHVGNRSVGAARGVNVGARNGRQHRGDNKECGGNQWHGRKLRHIVSISKSGTPDGCDRRSLWQGTLWDRIVALLSCASAACLIEDAQRGHSNNYNFKSKALVAKISPNGAQRSDVRL